MAPQPQPQPTAPVVRIAATSSALRALISICETAAFIIATTLALMNNGTDFRHAVATAFIGFIAHGVNHNAGGSPV